MLSVVLADSKVNKQKSTFSHSVDRPTLRSTYKTQEKNYSVDFSGPKVNIVKSIIIFSLAFTDSKINKKMSINMFRIGLI